MSQTTIKGGGVLTAQNVTDINANFTDLYAGGSGETLTDAVLVTSTATTTFNPTVSDGTALGDTTHQFSDLFLAEGGVINWDNGDATITQANNVLTVAGAALTTTSADLTTPVFTGTITGTYTLGGTPTLASAAGVPYVAGAAAGYKIARSPTPVAVTGTSDVTTGLTTVLAAVACAESDLDGTNLASVQAVVTGGAGHILLKCWKITAADNGALVAASAAKNVSWIAIGT